MQLINLTLEEKTILFNEMAKFNLHDICHFSEIIDNKSLNLTLINKIGKIYLCHNKK